MEAKQHEEKGNGEDGDSCANREGGIRSGKVSGDRRSGKGGKNSQNGLDIEGMGPENLYEQYCIDTDEPLILFGRCHTPPQQITRSPSLWHSLSTLAKYASTHRSSSSSSSTLDATPSHPVPLLPTLSTQRGAFILNPGQDLPKTQSALTPFLTAIKGWNGIIAKEPSARYANPYSYRSVYWQLS